MDYVIDFGFSTQQYMLDDNALTIHASNKVMQQQTVIPWGSVLAAGYSPRQQTAEADRDMQQITAIAEESLPPGAGWLMNKGIDIDRTTDWLLIAYQPDGKGRKLHYAHVWKDAPETQQLIEVMRQHLGDRWRDEPLDAMQFRREMRLSSWWVIPVAVGIMVAVCGVILGWAYIDEAYGYWLLGGSILAAGIGWLARRGTISLPWQQ
jgi:hypothetical protein